MLNMNKRITVQQLLQAGCKQQAIAEQLKCPRSSKQEKNTDGNESEIGGSILQLPALLLRSPPDALDGLRKRVARPLRRFPGKSGR